MADPTLSVAVNAAAKLGSAVVAGRYRPIGQPRVGGREERRQVYTRFQEAVVVYVMQIRDSRISPEAMGLEANQRKPYIDALMTATTELAQALYEVRLVGNPGPIEAAETVRQAVGNSFDAAAARRGALTDGEAELYARAMREFTSACRLDLWYQPRGWQLWRAGWWKQRWVRITGRRPDPVTEQSPTPAAERAAQPDGVRPPDAVFGGGGGVIDEGLLNRGGMISGTVMGSLVQTGVDVTGVVIARASKNDEDAKS